MSCCLFDDDDGRGGRGQEGTMENGEAKIRRSLVACCCGPNPALRLKAQLTPKYYRQLLLPDGGCKKLNTTTPCNKPATRQGDTAECVFVGWFGVFGTTVTKSKAMASTELSCTHSRDCIIKLVHVLHATFKVYSRINWLFWKYKITVCKTILYSPVLFYDAEYLIPSNLFIRSPVDLLSS